MITNNMDITVLSFALIVEQSKRQRLIGKFIISILTFNIEKYNFVKFYYIMVPNIQTKTLSLISSFGYFKDLSFYYAFFFSKFPHH